MNGAEALLRTLVASGVETCFANPGTSEMHFVAALDRVPGMRPILALAEGVATGAADGYARIAGRPAATLLHCGPGLANGLSNLHNARRAGVPLVNLVGDQAHHHRPLDPPLAAETENLARSVSHWTRTVRDVHAVGSDAAAAVSAARSSGGTIASLILPSDVCWDEGAQVAPPQPLRARARVDDSALAQAAEWAARGRGTALLLGGDALHGEALRLAGRIAASTGARLMCPGANARIERGRNLPAVERIPYAVEAARRAMQDVQRLILVGSQRPVYAFAGPGSAPGRPEPAGLQTRVLATVEQDIPDALARWAERLKGAEACRERAVRPAVPATGDIHPEAFGRSLAALLPPDSVVVDEGVTFGRGVFDAIADAEAHDWLQLTGGAIGSGLPMATGAAVAGKGRRVVSLQADGSALYSMQALWTQARERLDVTTVIFSNRKYAILFDEMARVHAQAGPNSRELLCLDDPAIDWLKIAQGFGVEAASARSMDEFNDLFACATKRRGPFLIELLV